MTSASTQIFPARLQKGDGVRVIAPAQSMSLPFITKDILALAKQRLEGLGLKVSLGKHVGECNEFNSSAVASRIEDLHDAFQDPEVKLVLTIMGGFNSNELLPHLDYDIIRKHPKMLCGYSDITALENGIFAKTGLVTYSGPHYFDFGEKTGFDYTLEHFKKCLFHDAPFSVQASAKWSNDRWGKDQDHRTFHTNPGLITLTKGSARGTILIANLVTFLGLLGSEYAPSLAGSILFIEDDHEENLQSINRALTQLTYLPDFKEVQGIAFGRFQPESNMGEREFRLMIANNHRLQRIPIISGLDFGHTTPRMTFPIGGVAEFDAQTPAPAVRIIRH